MLVAAVAQSQDRTAFVELFDYFAPRLASYLQRLGSDPSVAEEITQDVMLTLWRKAELFDPEKSSLATWLYRVARNRRIDLLRRQEPQSYDYEDVLLEMPDTAEGPSALLENAQMEERVRAALGVLPPAQRALIQLAFFDGLSHTDIAEKTGVPLGTVKSRIRLSFKRLRRVLEGAGLGADEG
jgi:RNA polymerase sigma factor (sigma-70 family)